MVYFLVGKDIEILHRVLKADVVKDLRRVTISYPRKEFDLFERNQASKTFPKTY